MVGLSGFEPETFCTPSKRATRLRYSPRKKATRIITLPKRKVNPTLLDFVAMFIYRVRSLRA